MDFVADDGFARGVLVSLVFVVPVAGVLLAVSRRLHNGVSAGGALAVVASLLALSGTDVLTAPVVAGVLAAGAGGAVAMVLGLPPALRWVLVAPGAALALTDVDGAAAWMVVAGVASVAVMGPAADVVDGWYRRTGLAVAMLCVTTAGVFVTVPETGSVLVVLGVIAPVGLLAVPRALVSLGPGGATAMLTLLAVLTLDGGWTRHGAIVGGLLAPGLLALLVLVPAPPPAAVAGSWPPVARLHAVLHVTLVLGVTRVAGLLDGAVAAAVVATAMGALALAVARRAAARVVGAAAGER